MNLKLFQVDAFAERAFSGNPAAVCLLTEWLAEPIMQAIASEMNLSETAFIVPKFSGGEKTNEFRLRWFTPTNEIKLCGHATLASAHVLYTQYPELVDSETPLTFHTLSGPLKTSLSDNGMIELDFPSQPVIPVTMPDALADALGATPVETWGNEDLIALFSDPSEVTLLEPDMGLLKTIDYRGVIVASVDHSGQYDFVSRFFAPKQGVDEDPVTGSAHTQLVPLFKEKLGKSTLLAYQASKRGGVLLTRLSDDELRVHMSGKAVTVMDAVFFLDI